MVDRVDNTIYGQLLLPISMAAFESARAGSATSHSQGSHHATFSRPPSTLYGRQQRSKEDVRTCIRPFIADLPLSSGCRGLTSGMIGLVTDPFQDGVPAV